MLSDVDSHSQLYDRRRFLLQAGGGLAGTAVSALLHDEQLHAAGASHAARFDLTPKQPHFEPRARSVIFIFLGGGPSQMDLFDPKPALNRLDGTDAPESVMALNLDEKTLLKGSPFRFAKHGQSGMQFSELLPHLGGVADDLTLVRSLHTFRNVHGQGINLFNTGFFLSGYPSLGAWVTYGLGSENQNLPAYIAIPGPGRDPRGGARLWNSAWLPPLYQGTRMAAEGLPVFDLKRSATISARQQRQNLDLTARLNRLHLASHPGSPELETRIMNYEMAVRMQLATTEQVDITQETAATQQAYGLDSKNEKLAAYGRRCLLARRLIEGGVRFVHLFAENQVWDHHQDLTTLLPQRAKEVDQPIAALIADLKQRGLLDSTLVVIGGEFGRMPYLQNGDGRDHNPHGFSIVMAGGGLRRGLIYGATDELGYAAVKDKVSVHDLHATLLHLVGLDVKHLKYPHQGRQESIVGVEKVRIVKELFA